MDRGAHGVELTRELLEMGAGQVQVVFVDYNGIPRGRSIMVEHLDAALERGVNFSSPTVDFNSRDLFPAVPAFDLASPDFWALPDPATCRPVPGSPAVARMYSDLVDAAGRPWEGCPRTALRRAVQRAADLGLVFTVGFEPEGYVFRAHGDPPGFVSQPAFATADGLDLLPDFMHDLLSDLKRGGLDVLQWSEEYGPGQIEINLRHAEAMPAADGLVTFKQTFRSTARRHGLLGTFMPKPFGDQAGTGLHLHLSASPVDDAQRNLFDGATDRELGLSGMGRSALGGLLAHGEALTALGATTVNSYKRFLPGSWAPTHIVHAYASRAAFIRIPERETPRRLELRVGDGAGNPYLFLTGVLAAALDGIERRLGPGPAAPGDLGALSQEEAQRLGIRPVPRTLEAALAYLERDEVMRGALGSLILDEVVKIKRSEWEAFCSHVGAWDREWYLERY